MPQLFKIGNYWVYFWSNEGIPVEPVHVHVLLIALYRMPPKYGLLERVNVWWTSGCLAQCTRR